MDTPQTWQTPPQSSPPVTPAYPPTSSFFSGPPKATFALGIMIGVSAVSLLGFILSFSAYRNAVDGGTGTKKVAVNSNANTNTAAAAAAPSEPVDITVAKTDWIRGNKNAKVTLMEFSDFQCPYCEQFNPTVEQVRKDYPNTVRIVYKHYPLTSIHPLAQKAAEAAECAGAQKKFWEMHDKLFANQTSLSVDNYKAWAKELGLNQSKFDKCLDNGDTAAKVAADQKYGDSIGVTGTPTSFVNGYSVQGAQSYETVKAKIDAELAKT
jgi:protein-disulfide isomerase